MQIFRSLFLLGALGAGVAVSPVTVLAQPGAVARPPKNDVKALIVKNARASIIAYWLDPVHNAKPAQLRSVTELNVVDSRTDEEREAELAKFEARFPGLQAVTPLDAQNSLIVLGTAEAIAKVTEEVTKLDKPLKMVEVEVAFAQIEPKDFTQLGLRYTAPDADKVPANVIAGIGESETVRKALKAMALEGKAKFVAVPRMTLIDNIGSQIDIKTSLPATIGVRGADGEFRELKTQGDKTGALTIEMSSSLFVTPAIQDDGTVTLSLRPARQLRLTDSQREIPLRVLENRQVVINAKAGDTVAVNGVTLGGSIQDALAGLMAQPTVMLVTSRIIQRAGE